MYMGQMMTHTFIVIQIYSDYPALESEARADLDEYVEPSEQGKVTSWSHSKLHTTRRRRGRESGERERERANVTITKHLSAL